MDKPNDQAPMDTVHEKSSSESEQEVLQGKTPMAAYLVSSYHLFATLAVVGVALYLEKCLITPAEWNHQVYALLCGGLGGVFTASRYVVLAVRHRKYDPNRLLWQVLTPIYSAALGWIGVVAVKGGILVLASEPSTKEPNFTYFVMGFAFLVGFASEAFVKRLIMAAQTLFGEHDEEKGEILR